MEAGWRPFEAVQDFEANPVGFVWDVRIRMAPLTEVQVRDGYVGGRASMYGAVLGIVPVVQGGDSPELRAGALQRYLAEAVWLPTVLLHGRGLSWATIDDTRARATLANGGATVALDFEFSAGGEIVGVYTPARLRASTDNGGYVALPWDGRYRRYEERGGMWVPLEAEVYLVVDGREQPYYRGRNVSIDYDFGKEPR